MSAMNEAITKMIQTHQLEVEKLTEQQLAELLRQVLLSGDILRYSKVSPPVVLSEDKTIATFQQWQSVSYEPFRQSTQLRSRAERAEQLLHWVLENGCTDYIRGRIKEALGLEDDDGKEK
jgi:hypothetical protein